MPEISVLMSVYNGKEFIRESVESILNQTYSDFEFIIVDDGSTDNTVEIIKSYNDSRIKLYVLEENVGVGAALQYGLTKVSEKYLAKADADDIYLPTRFEKQKKFLDKNTDIDLVKTLIEYFPDNEDVKKSSRYIYMKNTKEKQLNIIRSSEQIKKRLYWWCCIPHTSIMAKAKAVKKICYQNLKLGEDYNLFYKMNKKGYKMATLKENLVKVRVRDSSITGIKSHQKSYVHMIFDMKRAEWEKLIKKDDRGLFIWGTGNLGRYVYNLLQMNNYKIDGFIDGLTKNQGLMLYEKMVNSPDYFLKQDSEKNKVIVCSQPAREEIVSVLEENHYEDLKDFIVFA